ncbi:MAG: hypothetical protein ACR2LF_01155 [Jatrophihabitantaceae bacterium]
MYIVSIGWSPSERRGCIAEERLVTSRHSADAPCREDDATRDAATHGQTPPRTA